jgi:PAS domain S-box-containing protein
MTEANDTLAHMLGYKKGEELLGMRLNDFQPRTDPECVAHMEQVVREKFNLIDFKSGGYGQDGENRNFLSNTQGIFLDGKLQRIWGTSRDITEQIIANQERERILMLSKDLISIAGIDGYLKYVNLAWESILGYSAKELLEHPYLEFVHPEDRDHVKQELTRLAEGHPTFDLKLRAICKDGSIRHISWMIAPYLKDNLLYCIGRDITDRIKSEEEALKQRDILARMGRTTRMGQLTGSIAHELNQPLTGILSNAQAGEMMIEKGQYNDDELAEILADIAADTKRASEVIRNLRELYREQKGKHQAIDINAIINETIKLIQSELVMQHVVLTTECDSSIPLVHGNRIQIQQVLVNLIMNGIQAMGDMARDDRRLHIATIYDENEVRARVEDSGPGIDVDKIDSIFEPLVTWKSGGTGMGLAISNSIIEAHGGRMCAENRSEGGARVGFTLPVLKGGKEA